MKIKNKIIFISLILLVLLSITCVSAQETAADNTFTASDSSISEVSTSYDNIIQSNESNSEILGIFDDSQMNVLNYNGLDDTSLGDGAVSTKLITPSRTINIEDAVSGYDYQIILRDINGNPLSGKAVSFDFNGKTSTEITNSNGWATTKLTADTSGNFDVKVTFKGDADYKGVSQVGNIKIIKNEVNFVAPDRTLYLEDIAAGYSYPVILRDSEGNALSKKQVTLTFNGKKLVGTTDNRGYCYFTISADKAGSYGVNLRFDGDQYYYGKSCSNFKTVEVIERKNVTFIAPDRTIHVEDISSGYSYPVLLKDSDGNALAKKQISLIFNGIKYIGTTNSRGYCYFDITVNRAGSYPITLNFEGDRYYYSKNELHFKTVNVIKWDVEFVAKDKSVYLDDISGGYKYSVSLKDSDGNALAKKQITLTFNGKTLTGTTNSNGNCYFNITASKAGLYGVSLKFAGDRYCNSKSCSNFRTVEVIVMKNVTFVAPDRTLNLEDISGGYSYPVLLRDSDGKALANKKISLTFNGQKLTGTTDSKGYCYFNIKADKVGSYGVTLEFAGDKYYYPNLSQNYRTVTVNKEGVNFVLEDKDIPLDKIYFGYKYPVLLKDSHGNALANKKITLTFNGKKLTGTTDSKGYCYFELTYDKMGTFDITVEFAGDGHYTSKIYSKSVKVTESTNPYGKKAKKAWINTDSGSDDMKNAVANLLRKLGWEVYVSGTGPGYHYYDYFNVYDDYVYITMYNGFCAGTVREAYSSSIQRTLERKDVQLVIMWDTRDWTNPQGMAPYRYGDFTGYTAHRAWDDDFSPTDPTIVDVGSWLKSQNSKYCAYPSAEGLVAQFVAGGYFAYSGK
ncbi:Ig-like domain-containing protein [Methanobrevibacter sp.]|uniref:Ig-like domain-containing protein n=1 Tax=Methanobrevibacter sp. TaxID=66852 RepID=UPI003862E6C9